MTWNAFFEEIKGGTVRNVYLFTGEEELVKREATEKLRQALLPSGLEALNETLLEDADAGTIIEAAETLPVFCERRLVVVRDWPPLLSASARDAENRVRKMLDYFGSMGGACTLVFTVRGDLGGQKKLMEDFQKGVTQVDFSPLSDPEIHRWIAEKLKPARKKMSGAAMRQLLLVAGHDLTRLEGEIAKLTAYVGTRADIDETDIEKVVSPSLEYGAFDMINHLFEGDAPGAYRLLSSMLERGASRVSILASITYQLRGMLHASLTSRDGVPPRELAKLLGIKEYPAKLMAQNARRCAAEDLERIYLGAVDADNAIKSGQMRDAAALDRVFLEIAALSHQKSATKPLRGASK